MRISKNIIDFSIKEIEIEKGKRVVDWWIIVILPNGEVNLEVELDDGSVIWDAWFQFKEYEPLPMDKEGNTYFPPSTGFLVADLEVRPSPGSGFQFIDKEDKNDPE
jgi:hypothetical protein